MVGSLLALLESKLPLTLRQRLGDVYGRVGELKDEARRERSGEENDEWIVEDRIENLGASTEREVREWVEEQNRSVRRASPTSGKRRARGSTIDDQRVGMVPLDQGAAPMTERAVELLERIARNTEPLPGLAAFLKEQMLQLRADYRAGRFDSREYVRRYRKLHAVSRRIQ